MSFTHMTSKAALRVATLLLLMTGLCWAATGPAKMVLTEPTRNLGIVTPGQKIDLVFQVENQGGEPLTIDVKPTCGCTVANWDHTVAPGQAGKINATIDTAGMRGVISKAILVVSNDAENPTQRIVVSADVQPVLEILPRPLLRMNAIQGQTASATVTLAPVQQDTKPFEVISIEAEAPYVTAQARPLDPQGPDGAESERFEIAVSVGEDAPLGFINVPVVVHTSHPTAKEVRFKVVGTIRKAS